MPRKPASLIYGVDDTPSLGVRLALATQHVIVTSVGWLFVVVVVAAIGGTQAEAADVIRASMIASGVATILQARRLGPIGSGYLCPSACGPAYIAASIQAGRAGGIPLILGFTIMAGVLEGVLSRALTRLRVLFPPEVTGLVVAMVGVELVTLAAPRFLGYVADSPSLDGRAFGIAMLTLAAMVGPTVWGGRRLRLYPVLFGLVVGCASALATGAVDWRALGPALDAPLVALPALSPIAWRFDVSLAIAFGVACVSSTLKGVGDLTLCQKINDADWKRTDMTSASGGVLAGAIGTGLAGLAGAFGQSTFSSNVGLSMATGATSRAIALPCGLILIGLAFLPRLANLFALMPDPVIGAILVYVACFMIVGGFQVMMSRLMDARRTFVVGIALFFGLSVHMEPAVYAELPAILQPLVSSGLSLATVLVIVLNLVSRIGVSQRRTIRLSPDDEAPETIWRFMTAQGAAWGARPDVIYRATGAMNEFMEHAGVLAVTSPDIAMEVRFDELNLDVEIRYDGHPIELPLVQPPAGVLHERDALAGLAGFMIRRYADQARVDARDGHVVVRLHFDH